MKDKPKKKRDRAVDSKYERPIHIPAEPEDVARSLFREKPKPKGQWRYLKKSSS